MPITHVMSVRPKELADVVLDALPVAVLIADETSAVVERNRLAAAWLPAGTRVAEVLQGVTVVGRPVDWPAEIRRLAGGGAPLCCGELALPRADGGRRRVDLHANRLEGSGEYVLIVLEDVTDRVTMVRRLASTERMAGVGKLAAKVAHELNNPLDGILRFLGLAQRAVETGDAGKGCEHLKKARVGVERMTGIVADLLDYSRAAGREWPRLRVADAIDQALDVMTPHLEAAAATVVCDIHVTQRCTIGGEMFQVLCNLIKNGLDAMRPGGRLTLTAACEGLADVITVGDTGCGLDPDALIKVFDPFFTTKPAGTGTGLGLAICRDIVNRAGGTITLANRPGGGAIATVSLPHRQGGTGGGDE